MKAWKTAVSILVECICIAAVYALLLYLLNNTVSLDDLRKAFVVVLIYAVAIISLATPVFGGVKPYVCDRGAVTRWTVFVTVLITVCTVGCLVGSVATVWLSLQGDVPLPDVFLESMKVSVPIALLVGISHAIFEGQRDRLGKSEVALRTMERENERALKLAAEARLAALEARLHPHFLFNALNSVSSLIPTAPEHAERLIERMAAVLRFCLDATEGGLVSVHDELKIVEDYLEIEQARLGSRLRYSIDVDPNLNGARVPPLSIQTLIENSVRHAISPFRQGGEASIRVTRSEAELQVEVVDSGAAFALESFPPGHGLDNLRRRLAVLFGDAASIRFGRVEGRTVARLTIPISCS